MSVIGLDVKLLPVARMHTLGVSGSSPAWLISLCNAIASAEGVDIIPKQSHPNGMPTSQQTSKQGGSATKQRKEGDNCWLKVVGSMWEKHAKNKKHLC